MRRKCVSYTQTEIARNLAISLFPVIIKINWTKKTLFKDLLHFIDNSIKKIQHWSFRTRRKYHLFTVNWQRRNEGSQTLHKMFFLASKLINVLAKRITYRTVFKYSYSWTLTCYQRINSQTKKYVSWQWLSALVPLSQDIKFLSFTHYHI